MRFDREPRPEAQATGEVVFEAQDVSVYYDDFRAIRNVDLPIYQNQITALDSLLLQNCWDFSSAEIT